MADQRLHDELIRAELEDCKLLQKEISTYLAFWGIAGESPEARPPIEASPAARAKAPAN
jgi:hypothetical protein